MGKLQTSAASMNRSISSSSSHLASLSSSGPVATKLRGPIEAVAMSLYCWGVLAGEDRAGMNGLALGD